jgi:hypothetical protein
VLRVWREAGLPLGNHAFSHMDLHQNTARTSWPTSRADEPVLERLMGRRTGTVPFPYLNAGETPEKRRAAEAGLAQRGYPRGRGHIDFADWSYHDTYARCAREGDAKAVGWLKQTYLDGGRAVDRRPRAPSRARCTAARSPTSCCCTLGDLNAVMTKPLLACSAPLVRRRPAGRSARATPPTAVRPAVAVPHGDVALRPGNGRSAGLPDRAPSGRPCGQQIADLCK